MHVSSFILRIAIEMHLMATKPYLKLLLLFYLKIEKGGIQISFLTYRFEPAGGRKTIF